MDPQHLLQLLADSTKRLSSLHAELGHPPERLEEAVAALYGTLRNAVENQLDQVQKEVEEAKSTLTNTVQRTRRLRVALGESSPETEGIDPGKNHGHGSLLSRVASTNAEMTRLQSIYDGRRQQANKLNAELASFIPILGDFVPRIDAAASPRGEDQTPDPASEIDIPPLPTAYLTKISSAIDKCGHELTRRSEELQSHLYEILGLWSELCLPPESHPPGDSVTELSFDALILRHLRLRTAWEEIQLEEGGTSTLEFQGTFLPAEDANSEVPSSPGTPSRAGGSGSTTLQSMRTAETHFPPHVLQPTPANIARAQQKRNELEEEKSRRESRIQELYDDLFSLWVKFEVPEEDMDKFVMGNSGSTMAVIEAYEGELEKMRELKQQHMALFLGKVRERIEELWAELRLSEQQREITFPDFFQPIETMDPAGLDALLARHEERVADLEVEIEKKGPLLKLVARYLDLCEEERQLEESAKDTSRLMKGVRGDPGRLLREEKMRKRVKVQKPKLEAELLKAIPAWEAETEQTFTIDGEKYLEKIQALSGGDAAKKRARVASVATPAATTPGVLQHSSAHVNRTATTQFRTPSAMPQGAARRGIPSTTGTGGAKKPKLLAQGQSVTPRLAATPTAAHIGNLRARVAPAATAQNRLPSSSRIPMPASPPKAHNSQFTNAASTKAAIARVSATGYQAGHSFRPRPSQLARGMPGSAWQDHGGTAAPGGLPRNMSGASIASDATTLCYPGATVGSASAYAQAIPARSASTMPPMSGHKGRSSVNHGKSRRGPSMTLEGALTSLAAAGYPRPRLSPGHDGTHTIRSVSSELAAKDDAALHGTEATTAGGNWAVLEEEEEMGDGYGQEGYPHDEMEVF